MSGPVKNPKSKNGPLLTHAAGGVIGGAIGESAGLALGVHLADRRRGSVPLELVASTAIGLIGLLVLYENQSPPIAPIVLVATPLAQLASVIAIERR